MYNRIMNMHNLSSDHIKNKTSFVSLVLCLSIIFSTDVCGIFSPNTYALREIETSSSAVQIVKSIAVLPFENLTDNTDASVLINHAMVDWLAKKSIASIVPSQTVEDYLARKRIRYTGAVPRVQLMEMKKDLAVDAALVGSINEFISEDKGGGIKVGVTARLLSTRDGNILWAESHALNGQDFIHFLGLGEITSIDVLVSRVAKDLLSNLGNSFPLDQTAESPFEVEKIYLASAVSKAGDTVPLRIKMLSVLDEPVELKAVINDREILLKKGADKVYEGSVYTPVNDGIYHVDVVALDSMSKKYEFKSAAKIIVDSKPPDVILGVENRVFSPKRNKFVLFVPRMNGTDEISEWRIEILDTEGKRIRGDKGYGKLPKSLIWKGETDARGRVAEGEYMFRFTARDIAGNETVLSDRLKVKNKPPVVKVDFEVQNDKIIFTFSYDKGEYINRWSISILDKEGKMVKVMEEDGELPLKVEVPITENMAVSRLAFSVVASDEAGNQFTVTKTIPSVFKFSRRNDEVGSKAKIIEDF